MKILVLCVDRDDDIGVKTGIKTPLIGREANLNAATKLGLADPEDSDVNALLSAISTYDGLVRDGQLAEIATICGDVHVGSSSDLILAQQLDQVLEQVRPDVQSAPGFGRVGEPVDLLQRLRVDPRPRRHLLRGRQREPRGRAELRRQVPRGSPRLRLVLRPRAAPVRRREGVDGLHAAWPRAAPRPRGRGHLHRGRVHRPGDDQHPGRAAGVVQPQRRPLADLPEHRRGDLPRRDGRPVLSDAGTPLGDRRRRVASLRIRMEFESWEPFYLEILKDFGFSREADEEVARELDAFLGGTRASDEELLSLFEGEEVTVAGNGPNLAREIDGAPGVLVTADEATTVAMARGRIPAAVVTDLDGTVSDQVKANDAGSIVLVHGHGDNGPAVRKWAPLFAGKTVATTQSRPTGGLRNFGGFTDGDRAVFLADHFGAAHIHLVGFDFEHPSPKDADLRTKQRKLDWAYILIGNLERDDLDL